MANFLSRSFADVALLKSLSIWRYGTKVQDIEGSEPAARGLDCPSEARRTSLLISAVSGSLCGKIALLNRHPDKSKTLTGLADSAQTALVVTNVVGAWCASNTGIVLMNKLLLSSYGFRCPILLTLVTFSHARF